MLMGFYTEEQIKKARSIDLMTYLRASEPTELIHVSGNTYCTRTHLCTVNFNAHLSTILLSSVILKALRDRRFLCH